ncbi:MAG TPA: NAD(P)H-hydrate dehydratase, partial [Myxococcaceae bacterium]|nr:NAD(P)H-hydrate dehydratase [Myxococcaceae bacterium]
GPGIPRGPETHVLLGELLARLDVPVLLDADGLNAIAGHPELLDRSRAAVVLTPHPGEMSRLTGKTVGEVQAQRIATATSFARAHRAVVVLKGARSIVADPAGPVRVNPTGNPGMATGGTGDVLSGMVGAFLAQGLPPVDAASVGVLAHGLAGDAAARRWGRLGLIASDLTAALGKVWTAWAR